MPLATGTASSVGPNTATPTLTDRNSAGGGNNRPSLTKSSSNVPYHRKQTDIESAQKFIAAKGLPNYGNIEHFMDLMPSAMKVSALPQVTALKGGDVDTGSGSGKKVATSGDVAPLTGSAAAARASIKNRTMTVGPAEWSKMAGHLLQNEAEESMTGHNIDIISHEAFNLLTWHFFENLCLQMKYKVNVLLYKNENESSKGYIKCLEKLKIDTYGESKFGSFRNDEDASMKDCFIKVEFLSKGKGSLFFSDALVEKLLESDERDRDENNVEVRFCLFFFFSGCLIMV